MPHGEAPAAIVSITSRVAESITESSLLSSLLTHIKYSLTAGAEETVEAESHSIRQLAS